MFLIASPASLAAASAPSEPIQALVVSGADNDSWPFGKADKGCIPLQDHGDEVAYHNLRIKKL